MTDESNPEKSDLGQPFSAPSRDDPAFVDAQKEIDQLLKGIGETGDADEFKQDVRTLPKHGVFFRWPAEGDFDWVHPKDRALIQTMIPGSRIFCRDQCDDPADQAEGYYWIEYGEVKIRVKPAMWLLVNHEGYEVGDRVEVKSKQGKHTPLIGNIREIEYDAVARRTIYLLRVNDIPLKKKFFKNDIRPCRRLDRPLSVREIEMLNQHQL